MSRAPVIAAHKTVVFDSRKLRGAVRVPGSHWSGAEQRHVEQVSL